MDGADFFLNLAHREEDREWRKEDRAWRAEERRWKRLDRQWRSEDRRWRRNDRRYRILDDARRKTDEWAEMINDIANVSALLAGFATAALVEVNNTNLFLINRISSMKSHSCERPEDCKHIYDSTRNGHE